MVLYCESSQSSVDLPTGVGAEHNVTGFCIKPVTRSELPQLDMIIYLGKMLLKNSLRR